MQTRLDRGRLDTCSIYCLSTLRVHAEKQLYDVFDGDPGSAGEESGLPA